jgi:hypothetical protein
MGSEPDAVRRAIGVTGQFSAVDNRRRATARATSFAPCERAGHCSTAVTPNRYAFQECIP